MEAVCDLSIGGVDDRTIVAVNPSSGRRIRRLQTGGTITVEAGSGELGGGGDGHRLEVPENVGEPEADETNVALFEGPEHEFLLTIHERESKQTELNLCYIVNSVSLRETLSALPRS